MRHKTAARWKATLLSLILFLPGMSLAEIGTVVAVTQPARLSSEGEVSRLTLRTQVVEGDTVATGEGGEIQLLFPDETKIVVGPNSQLKIQRLLFRNNNKARRFRVDAVAGTFRLLTGDSPKRAFRVRTPTASMAVRGTQFDFVYEREERDTTLVVHDGAVQMCAIDGRCAFVPSGCHMVSIDRLRRFRQPATKEERAAILARFFPYAPKDADLEPLFRALIDACADDDDDPAPLAKIELPPDPEDEPDDEDRRGNPAE